MPHPTKPGLQPNDPRVVELARLVRKLFPGYVFFVAVASVDGSEPLASIGNMDTEGQVLLLRTLLNSFEGGSASPMQPVLG